MTRATVPLLTILGVTIAALAAMPDAALAQEETIDACVHNGSGVLYLPEDRDSAGEACAKKDDPLSWNEQGPQGTPGPPGPPGPQGPPGILTTTVVEATSELLDVPAGSHRYQPVTVKCPAGWTALGGGHTRDASGPSGVLTLQPGITAIISRPTVGQDGWFAFFRLDNHDGLNDGKATVTALAVCAELSS